MSEDTVSEVHIGRLPISVPCPVPIRPGDPDVLDEMGEPIDLAERTEFCAVDAHWMIGSQVTCDAHLRVACDLAGIDFAEVEAECGKPRGSELKPWGERKRYPQGSVLAR